MLGSWWYQKSIGVRCWRRPRYYSETQEYVRNCETCQRFKVEQRAPAGLMGRRVIDKPWQVVAGDIIGPLPRTSKGCEYILVFQDLFTRWVEASPIRKANAKAVIAELNRKIFLRYGCPEVFLSDNGTEFKNHVVEDFLRERGVHHTHTLPYHPQTNPVERANRTLKTMVASYLKERHSTWGEKLPELLFALNTAEQSSTGVSSALLLYGRQPEPHAAETARGSGRHPGSRGKLDSLEGAYGCPSRIIRASHCKGGSSSKSAKPGITMPTGGSQASNRAIECGSGVIHFPRPPRASRQNYPLSSKARIGLRTRWDRTPTVW